jgi:hypothetical protein
MRSSICLFVLFSTLGVSGCGESTPAASSPSGPRGAIEGPKSPGQVDPSLPKPVTAPESAKVTWKNDSPAKPCHTGAKTSDVAGGVAAMVKSCLDTNRMHQVGTTTMGEGSRTNLVQSIPLKARANHCYRVFGLAEPSVTDFDIAVIDSAGKSAGEDVTDSNDAVVLETGNVCFKVDDAVNVNVAVANGAGKWAVQIWSD